MQRTLSLLKQTLHPPKKTIPLAANPLTRWSRRIPQWQRLSGTLTRVAVGLEGCHSAFNATNSIRTCLFFQTARPPTFLTAPSWRSIEHVQTRTSTPTRDAAVVTSSTLPEGPGASAAVLEETDPFSGIAEFGESVFFSAESSRGEEGTTEGSVSAMPMVAVENFTDRAQSLMQTRLPAALHSHELRVVVGHENWGVRRSLLRSLPEGDAEVRDGTSAPVADLVVYVPQYGTISSLNVVTSLGIALFYCYLDGAHPESRTVYPRDTAEANNRLPTEGVDDLASLRGTIQEYQDYFKNNLPTPSESHEPADAVASNETPSSSVPRQPDANLNTTPRVDKRPIHPVFYTQNMSDIQARQQAYRAALLRYSQGRTSKDAEMPPLVSCDAKNPSTASSSPSQSGKDSAHPASRFFGISVLYENDFDQRNFGGLIRNANAFLVDHIFYVGRRKYNVVGSVGSYHYTPPTYLGPLPDADADGGSPCGGRERLEEWTASLKRRVDDMYGAGTDAQPPREWWLLDCGHSFLYTDGVAPHGGEAEDGAEASEDSAESLCLYQRLFDAADGRHHHLCASEDSLRAALANGVVLLVPQEGKLPHSALMRLCTGVLTVLPRHAHHSERDCDALMAEAPSHRLGHRGLPSQVASGIALQRLSAVLHPRLAAL